MGSGEGGKLNDGAIRPVRTAAVPVGWVVAVLSALWLPSDTSGGWANAVGGVALGESWPCSTRSAGEALTKPALPPFWPAAAMMPAWSLDAAELECSGDKRWASEGLSVTTCS